MAKLFSICFLLLFFLSCEQTDCKTQVDKSNGEEVAKCTPGNEIPGETGGSDSGGSESTGGSDGGGETTDPEVPGNPEVGDDLPREAYLFEINAELFKFTQNDEAKVRKAFEIIKKVIATKEFKEKVINYTYKGVKQFHQNDNFSNEEIYQMILDGKEKLLPVVDNRMNLELEIYTNNFTSTVGYTYPDTLRIYLNTKYFRSYTPAEVAGNLFHEWIHKVGFGHDSKNTAGRDSSVPYALGYIMRDLGKKYE